MTTLRPLLFPLLLLTPILANAQRANPVRHLTIFDANVAEFMEERTLDLQPGLNSVEFRSLMPQAFVRTLRVTGDRVTVVRQNITYDGPDVRNQKTPVLHLVLQNSGAAGARAVQVDYLAPNLSWKGDYSIVLAQPVNGRPPEEMLFDGWVTVQNDTGTDISAGTVDLVAGEVQLLVGGWPGRGQLSGKRADRPVPRCGGRRGPGGRGRGSLRGERFQPDAPGPRYLDDRQHSGQPLPAFPTIEAGGRAAQRLRKRRAGSNPRARRVHAAAARAGSPPGEQEHARVAPAAREP